MDDCNPYASPNVPPSPRQSKADSPGTIGWGKLNPVWTACFLFGYVWFAGSIGTYLLSFFFQPAMARLNPGTPDDAAGYISFITCSSIAIAVAIVLVLKRRRELPHGWSEPVAVVRSCISSCWMMAPWWIMIAVLAAYYRGDLPPDGNWVAIAAFALAGIVHGFLWKSGYFACVAKKASRRRVRS
ncbi:MAG: hypothetical protein HQ567_06910 [Candidatus Nealsonbacteria bacterium]|nr:hypothetical protein [Candidatus Nealsonbacteria bacterium]